MSGVVSAGGVFTSDASVGDDKCIMRFRRRSPLRIQKNGYVAQWRSSAPMRFHVCRGLDGVIAAIEGTS